MLTPFAIRVILTLFMVVGTIRLHSLKGNDVNCCITSFKLKGGKGYGYESSNL